MAITLVFEFDFYVLLGQFEFIYFVSLLGISVVDDFYYEALDFEVIVV